MKTLSTKKCFMLLGILAALLIIITPVVTLAGGGGGAKGEGPGVDCSATGEYSYFPPPYLGMVTVIYQWTNVAHTQGKLYLYGSVAKVGQNECVISISEADPFFWRDAIDFEDKPISEGAFREFKPSDIGGTCVQALPVIYFDGCDQKNFLQIVGAGKKMESIVACPENSSESCYALTFNAVVMELQCLSADPNDCNPFD